MAQDYHPFTISNQFQRHNHQQLGPARLPPDSAKLPEPLPKNQVPYLEQGIFLEFTIATIISSKPEPYAADWNALVIDG